jgi:hypothetical protein
MTYRDEAWEEARALNRSKFLNYWPAPAVAGRQIAFGQTVSGRRQSKLKRRREEVLTKALRTSRGRSAQRKRESDTLKCQSAVKRKLARKEHRANQRAKAKARGRAAHPDGGAK